MVANHWLVASTSVPCAPPPAAESKVRMENLLEVMMRLKNARNLDSRHAAAIDSAYFATRPPAGARGVRRRQRPPLHEYVRHLVFEELGEDSIVVVLKQLMKLP